MRCAGDAERARCGCNGGEVRVTRDGVVRALREGAAGFGLLAPRAGGGAERADGTHDHYYTNQLRMSRAT